MITPTFDWLHMVEATITALYQQELGRDPDDSGRASFLMAAFEGQDAEQMRAEIKASPEWIAKHTPAPAPAPPATLPFKVAPRTYSGNMCGIRVPGIAPVPGGASDSSLVLSWFYDRYDVADRAAIRAAWLAAGYLDVLLSWPDSRANGEANFVSVCQELTNAGLRPCVMLTSKDFDAPDVDSIMTGLGTILPSLLSAGVSPRMCIGWELSLWLSPIQVQQLIDKIAPSCVAAGVKLYVHFQEGYFAYQQPGGSTADFWNANVGKLTGVLHQKDLSQDGPMYQARITDCLQRFAGQFNFVSDSGFGHPFDFIALEISAQPQFNGQMTEAQGNALGDIALSTPAVAGVGCMGSGNGHT